MTKQLDISLYATPDDYVRGGKVSDVAIVFDIFRATTCMLEAFKSGCQSISPVNTVEEAFLLKKTINSSNIILGGERNAQKIEGFDFGNSPLDYANHDFHDKSLIYTTTNGTRALLMLENIPEIYIGGMKNLTALKDQIIEYSSISLVCAGRKGDFALEDFLAGGKLIELLYAQKLNFKLNDLAIAAFHLVNSNSNILSLFDYQDHAHSLKKLGYEADIKFCLESDNYNMIPRFDFSKKTINIKK